MAHSVAAFWQAYLKTLPANHPHRLQTTPSAWSFGYGAAMADNLAQLVLNGIKTATCCRYQGENVLDEAGLSIVLDGRAQPVCLIDTYEITVRRYGDIDAAWAKAEGEGDLSLEYWQEAHWQFFSEEGKLEHYTVSQDMLLLCERFRLLWKMNIA